MSGNWRRLRWLQAQYENAGQILAEDFRDAADEIEEYERAFSNLHREYDARGDRIEELEAKLSESEALLAKAVEALDEAIYLLDPEEEEIARGNGLYRIVTIFAELKGEK